MLTTKVYSGAKLSVGADLAIRARLYVPGWELRGVLQCMKTNHRQDSKMAITFRDSVPICVVVSHYGETMAFTRKIERKKGIGMKTFKAMKLHKMPLYGHGIKGSYDFWRKVAKTIDKPIKQL